VQTESQSRKRPIIVDAEPKWPKRCWLAGQDSGQQRGCGRFFCHRTGVSLCGRSPALSGACDESSTGRKSLITQPGNVTVSKEIFATPSATHLEPLATSLSTISKPAAIQRNPARDRRSAPPKSKTAALLARRRWRIRGRHCRCRSYR